MDTIWDKKSFEVGGHWPLWRGLKNRMTTQNRQKSNAKKTTGKTIAKGIYFLLQHCLKSSNKYLYFKQDKDQRDIFT